MYISSICFVNYTNYFYIYYTLYNYTLVLCDFYYYYYDLIE